MMKNKLRILTVAAIAACALSATALVGCSVELDPVYNTGDTELVNGGFETGDLSGWTVESGKAFDDDSVSSVTTFTFEDDAEHNNIPVNHTGNWYLSGKGYDGTRHHAYTGSIRSSNFILGGDGTISMKLAGGALTENGNAKDREKICFVGVYRASDDMMVAKFTNEYFAKHENSYVDVDKYENGTFRTDNFYAYTKNLATYKGTELYIRIVDNDTNWYYGYISVDDIRIGGGVSQDTGALFVKSRDYVTDVEAPSKYEIKNGGFETGSLAGWTIVSGDAFSHDGVNTNEYYWNENIPYNRDGDYHYGYYKPQATGVMRSSEFVLGGSGYISYKLGGCRNNLLTYLRFVVKDEDGDIEIKYSNSEYRDYQFPYVENGMRILNLVQYYADFSMYLGKTMYIEVVDESTSPDRHECIILDSVQTYWEKKPVWYTSQSFEAKTDPDNVDEEPDSIYQVKNGTFETGDLTGWTMSGNIGEVSDAVGWWAQNFPYNKKGKCLFTGINVEGNTGTLTSDAFTVGGQIMTFRMGGGANPMKVYVSIIDAETEEELARFGNLNFADKGTETLNTTSFLANMNKYKVHYADLGIEQGRRVKLRITDNATSNWGLVTADSFITYYESLRDVPKDAVEARNLLPYIPEKVFGQDDPHQIVNGNFETGDMTGWTKVSGNVNLNSAVSTANDFWSEGIPYNKKGLFHFDGWAAGGEGDVFAIRSENFTLAGSGRISFMMGGRTSVVKVYNATTNALVAEYHNTKFADKNFPYIDRDCRLATLTTYVADLSAHMGESLYIELCDTGENNWGLAFFDEIITYYETAPDLGTACDVVRLTHKTSSQGACDYRIPWVEAVNVLVPDNKE